VVRLGIGVRSRFEMSGERSCGFWGEWCGVFGVRSSLAWRLGLETELGIRLEFKWVEDGPVILV
jgi:hypothetical protein